MMYYNDLNKKKKLNLLSSLIEKNTQLTRDTSFQLIKNIIEKHTNPIYIYKGLVSSLKIK